MAGSCIGVKLKKAYENNAYQYLIKTGIKYIERCRRIYISDYYLF